MVKSKRNAYFKSELATRDASGEKCIEGYFAVFNQETELYHGVCEKITPGAFLKSLGDSDVRCLFNHDTGFVLGRTLSGTLELHEDSHGLWGKVKINPDDSQAMNIYARVQRGDISGCSFGFFPITEEKEIRSDSVLYTVRDVELYEVSVCTFPAYTQTEIQARQAEYANQEKRNLEKKKDELKKKLEALNAEKN